MPNISIAIPTYKRPELLRRCLNKLLSALDGNIKDFEVLVGDDSALAENEALLNDFRAKWGGHCRYIKHAQPLGQQGNFNDLIDHAKGRFIQFVHDDDFLLPGAGITLLQATQGHGERSEPLLFATVLVNVDEVTGRCEGTTRRGYLTPQEAVQTLLSKSSYIRFPAMVVPRSSYLAIGCFDPKEAIPDWPVWLKLAEKYGLSLHPEITNAYTIHEAAGTSKTFTLSFMLYLIRLLSSYRKAAGWSEQEMRRALGEFIHRYILAGCLRAAQKRDPAGFRQRFELFKHPEISHLPCPMRWLPLKFFAGTASCLIRPFHTQV